MPLKKFHTRGACRQAERKVCPSTRKPDLDNANVGTASACIIGDAKSGISDFFVPARRRGQRNGIRGRTADGSRGAPWIL